MSETRGWIEWNGSEHSTCPVPAGTIGHLQFRNEPRNLSRGEPYDISTACWTDTGRGVDIVAYRIARTPTS